MITIDAASTCTGGDGGDGPGDGFAGAAVNTIPAVGRDPGVANNNGSTLTDGIPGNFNP